MNDALKTSRSFTITETMSPSPDVVLAKKSKTVFPKPLQMKDALKTSCPFTIISGGGG